LGTITSKDLYQFSSILHVSPITEITPQKEFPLFFHFIYFWDKHSAYFLNCSFKKISSALYSLYDIGILYLLQDGEYSLKCHLIFYQDKLSKQVISFQLILLQHQEVKNLKLVHALSLNFCDRYRFDFNPFILIQLMILQQLKGRMILLTFILNIE